MNDWDRYGEWLMRRVGFVKKGYARLFKMLHDTEFYWVLDRDVNRAEDGFCLRDEYDGRLDDDSECSVLEMLVALAIRAEDEYIGIPGDEHPEKFFFEMLQNMGLDEYTDRRFDHVAVGRILDRWMSRKFTRQGLGSPFPVRRDRRDQRGFEIWDQMNHYIYENY